ncbi:MAG: lysine--tRNA ligase [Halobacteriales archaeon]
MAEGDVHVFWADEVADRIEARDPTEPIVVKGGVSPSGIPHLGNVNELLRGYFVAAVLRERGWSVKQVFTSDDTDRLRKVPRQLADLEFRTVDIGELDGGLLGRNLGKPYTDVPDPFGCCDSYGAHFTRLLEATAERLGLDIEFHSATEMVERGLYEPYVRRLLADLEGAREVLGRYQAKVDEDYVPFVPRCGNCGRLTERVRAVDLDAGTVEYECVDHEIAGNRIPGCGHRGTATFREGKLPWRFEWPAQWGIFGVDFEPFGKEHAEGSWPSGVEIAERLLDVEPPEPMVYEYFTLNGEALSSSTGNVITVPELLDLVEREVVMYFFTKDPRKARDLDVERIDLLVDEFDAFEAAYFGERDEPADLVERAARIYPFVVDEPRAERIRLPYTFAAVLAMTDDPALRREIADREGHLPPDAPEWAVASALGRVERAGRWAALTDNQYNYRLQRERLPVDGFDAPVEAALDDVADAVEAGADGDAIQAAIFEAAEGHGLDAGTVFRAGYQLLFDEPAGPKLGPFLAELDRAFVVERLRLEG